MASKVSMRGNMTEKKVEKIARKVANDFTYPETPFEVGKNYLIRTITMVDVGRVKKVVGSFVVLEDASWIGDTGRFHECLMKSDIFNEVEPFKHDVFVSINAIVDATPWPYLLPSAPK